MKRKTAVLALFCLPAVLFMGCSDLRAEDTATSTAAYAEEGGFGAGGTVAARTDLSVPWEGA